MCFNVHANFPLREDLDASPALDRDPLEVGDDARIRELLAPTVPLPVSDPATAEEVVCHG